MEQKGKLKLQSHLPFTLKEIKKSLFSLNDQIESLTISEKSRLEKFLREFSASKKKKKLYEHFENRIQYGFNDSINRIRLYSLDENRLFIRAAFQAEYVKNKNETLLNIQTQYEIFGSLYDKIHFQLLKSDQSIQGNKELFIFSKFNKSKWHRNAILNTEVSSSDHSRGFIAYDINKFNIFLGRIPWSIGFGESGKFVMNGFQTAIPTSFGVNLDFDWFRYSSIHSAITAPELMTIVTEEYGGISQQYRKAPDKFMVSHRFEVDLWDNFTIHQNEMIVYGNRSLDLNYLNPFSFLRPLEHELGDRDNALITIGFKWRLPKYHLITYHDFLLDEWKISEAAKYFDGGETWFGNKHGIMNGLSWANHNIQLWFEHVSIAPWVYTHKFDVNRYTHDSQPLGYTAGPNSQTFFYKAAYYPNPHWQFFLSHRIVHKGKNYDENDNSTWNIGGDIFKGHRNDNTEGNIKSIKETRKFLEGDLESTKQTIFNAHYQYNFYLSAELEYEYNWDNESVLKFYFSIQI
jgi:hypothetical protein